MDFDQLKHKLRELKKLELRIRFGSTVEKNDLRLIWDDFFDTKSINNLMVRYPIWKLNKLSKKEFKEAIEEFYYAVYFQKYKENGLALSDLYDPVVLSSFGLPATATLDDIKKKFRELAQKHHPDHGGDAEKMIEIIEAYHKLLDK